LLRIASGPGVNVRLHDAHRHSCTISKFFLRVPRRVSTWLPQCGQLPGTLDECGARAARGIGDIGEVHSPYHAGRSSRILRELLTHFVGGAMHGFCDGALDEVEAWRSNRYRG
jgi:hypothetical protein